MNALLLAPKRSRDDSALDDFRESLARLLRSKGHRPLILENEPGEPGETLRKKFLRLAAECEQAVLVWPEGAAMATTADEIILLQEAYDASGLSVILVLHEAEVELRDHELHVYFPGDQSRYLDGILSCEPSILPWPRGVAFADVIAAYDDIFL